MPMPDQGLLPVQVRGLVFETNGQKLLDIEVLNITAGGPTVILGPNGAGKSLLLRLLHGLIEPGAGTIVFANSPVGPQTRRRQAMVFQKPVLLRRTVAANVAFVLAAKGQPHRGRKAQVQKLLQDGGLSAKADQPARTLSGGEQQRLALIRAMAGRPEILFLDEPTSSLDPDATGLIEDMIQAATSAGTKVIMVTHNLGQAQRLARDIVFCHQGRVSEHTDAAAFFERPQSDAATRFVAGMLVR